MVVETRTRVYAENGGAAERRAGQNGGRRCKVGELWVQDLIRVVRYAEWREA